MPWQGWEVRRRNAVIWQDRSALAELHEEIVACREAHDDKELLQMELEAVANRQAQEQTDKANREAGREMDERARMLKEDTEGQARLHAKILAEQARERHEAGMMLQEDTVGRHAMRRAEQARQAFEAMLE